MRVRQSALDRLLALAGADAHLAAASRPVFVQALGDPNQAVRFQAFEQVQKIGLGTTELAAEALATGHVDLGVKGLELLAGDRSEAEGAAVLERAMLARTDDLAIESAKLLIARRGAVAVASRAVEATHPQLRNQAVNWLAAEYDKDPGAGKALRSALSSRYQAVREAAAFALAIKKDPAAFEPLVGDPGHRVRGEATTTCHPDDGDPGRPARGGVFLDRIENDPAGTAMVNELLKGVGRFRRPETADRLLSHWEKDTKRHDAVFNALVTISGYDQRIEDTEDEQPESFWLEKQFPRHDDVLARLMDRVSAPAEAKFLARLIPGARWARGKPVDPVLSGLINHANDEVRQKAVEAIGWRLRKRGSEAEPLKKALAHRDTITQFLAAEALAKAGRGDGMNVLLASIDFATDLDIRRRAVLALGELADERALDVLLKLAGEDGHALQEQALEAIGHLGRSQRADEVFKVLERHAKGTAGIAWRALNGLRWLNTRAAWEVIRARTSDPSCPFWEESVSLLGYNNDPATRDLLLRLLAKEADVVEAAMAAARRLWGQDSLEPDYAVVQNEDLDHLDDHEKILARLRDRGEPRRIFEILPKCPAPVRATLATGLLNRAEPPVAEALQPRSTARTRPPPGRQPTSWAEPAPDGRGRAGGDQCAGEVAKALGGTTAVVRPERRRPDPPEERTGRRAHRVRPGSGLGGGPAGRWHRVPGGGRHRAAGRRRVSADPPGRRPGPRLGHDVPGRDCGPGVGRVHGRPRDPRRRREAIARRDPERAARLADQFLSDRVGFHRLTLDGARDLEETLRTAARQVHYQGIVLPGLIDRGDV